MKKEFNLRNHTYHIKGIFNVLQSIFKEGIHADKALEKTMRANKKWGVKDRYFVSETVYDMLKKWRLLHAITGAEENFSEKKLWTLFGAWIVLKGFDLPKHPNFRNLSPEKILSKMEKFQKIRKIRESIPDWLDELGEKELEKKWDAIIHALNQKPSIFLRTNLLKTTTVELQKTLLEEKIITKTVAWAPEALELQDSRNVFRTEAFQQGLFEVQDAASQMVADFLDVKEGLRIIDACAGTGGKTLHLASLMRNKGRIIAMDIKEWKLQELRKRASRAGANIIETRVIESSKVIKRLENSADRLLLDVPCSGLGVLRRNPDSKWKLYPEEIEKMKGIQKNILEKFSGMTKIGGKMLYAVCSVLPSEGEDQVKEFLKENSKWRFLGEKRYYPNLLNCDGFYMAMIERIS